VETQALTKRNKSKIQAMDMKWLRDTEGKTKGVQSEKLETRIP
jgi:hypothetical protein